MSKPDDFTLHVVTNEVDRSQLQAVSKALEDAFDEASKELQTEKDPAVRAQWHNVRCNSVVASLLLHR